MSLKHYERSSNLLLTYIPKLITTTKKKYGAYIYRGADKSLARPGRKQATATELDARHPDVLLMTIKA